jgi:hypothetical protein
MLAGWFIGSTTTFAPASLLLSYWMVGCYFMAIKRFAEYRDIDDPTRATAYRKSFSFYTLDRLLVSIVSVEEILEGTIDEAAAMASLRLSPFMNRIA